MVKNEEETQVLGELAQIVAWAYTPWDNEVSMLSTSHLCYFKLHWNGKYALGTEG